MDSSEECAMSTVSAHRRHGMNAERRGVLGANKCQIVARESFVRGRSLRAEISRESSRRQKWLHRNDSKKGRTRSQTACLLKLVLTVLSYKFSIQLPGQTKML